MADSKIEWTDKTWNPVTGCTKISPGCKNCYAERMAERLQAMGQDNYRDGFQLTLQPHMLELPLRWKKPQTIFVNSMSDLFHKNVPVTYIQQVFDVMQRAHWHRFQVLTKRSDRLAEIDAKLSWAPNIWMGVSVEGDQYRTRIDDLRLTRSRTKFLSLEPLLGPLPNLDLTGIHWVIVGGESGPKARPMDPAWVTDIRDQCVKAGVPFFFKQWGGRDKKKAGRILEGRTWDEMPSDPVGASGPVGKSSRRIFLPVLPESTEQPTCRQGVVPTKLNVERRKNESMKKAPQKAPKKSTRKTSQIVVKTEIKRNKRAGRCAECDEWWDKGSAKAILLPSLATFFKDGIVCLDHEACAVRAAELKKFREDLAKTREERKQAKNKAWQKKNAVVLAEFDRLVSAHGLHAAPEGVEMVRCGPGPLLIEVAEGGRSQAQVWVKQGSLGVIAIDWRDGEKRRLFAEKHLLLSEDSVLLRTTKTSTGITTSFTTYFTAAKPAPKTKLVVEQVTEQVTEQATREATLRIVRDRSPFWDIKTNDFPGGKRAVKWVEITKPEEIGEVTKDPKVAVLVANLSISVADEALDSQVLVPLAAYAQQQHRRLGGFLLVICLSLDVPAGKQVEACIKACLGMLSKHLGFEIRGRGLYKSEQGEERVFTRISFGF